MHNPISKHPQPLAAKELLQVFASSWWQLDASHRDLVAKHREPIHQILAKLHNRDLEIRVIRRLEASDAHTDVGDDDRDHESHRSLPSGALLAAAQYAVPLKEQPRLPRVVVDIDRKECNDRNQEARGRERL